MKNHILRKAEEYTARRRSRRIWHKVVISLACLVVFCTVYALVLPAVTLENQDCGTEEHVHTEACYTQTAAGAQQEPVCTAESLNLHTHTESCYDQNGNLVCGYSDFVVHEHDDSCYREDGTLWCPLPEIEAHTHTAECYAQNRSLTNDLSGDTDGQDDLTPVCGKEEIILHTHTEECYTVINEETGETALTCGKQEVPEHVHSDSCFRTAASSETEELTCGKEEHTHTDACNVNPEQEYLCGTEAHTHSVEDGCYSKDGTTLICEKEEHIHTSLCALSSENRTQVQNVIDLIDALPTEEEIGETFTALLEAEDEEGYEAALTELIQNAKEAYDAYSALSDELKQEVTNADKLMALEAYWGGDVFVENTNPEFTVQYYANLPVAATSGTDDTLTLIDTSGGKLPRNNVTEENMPTMNLYLQDAGNGKYQVAMNTELTEVYQSHAYRFATASELQYINRLSQNGNYELREIWVLNEGSDQYSTNVKDWTVYSKDANFTNDPLNNDENTITILESTVIRLVYDTTSNTYTNAVNFYDYDITDDGKTTSTQNSDKLNQGHGINSTSNYSESGSKLAFGNRNTGTPYGLTAWNGNYLNAYSSKNYKGCTFGLVTSLDENGSIQYAPQVDAPNLFNDGEAKGKKVYDKGEYNLQFDRSGDTYTLSAVGGANLEGLQYFNNPTTGKVTYDIWTNNFWPMDSKAGKDGRTGTFSGNYSTGNTPIAIEKYTSNGTEYLYPCSDDGIAHNNMFGMQYAVQFTLTEDYVGPLDYYFFGDDDMWVFLDGELVCDIGGVHSSVGEYVNLWDYIEKGSSGTHTLSFFYTERGLSGSTCYMQFTLPSVSSATPGQQLGSLRVEKEVTGESTDQAFEFKLELSNDNNQYSYSKMNRVENGEDTVDSTGTIKDGGTFTLKDDQYIVMNNLPYGTKFTITETSVEGCTVTNTVGNTKNESNVATGTISSDNQTVTVHYTNLMSHKLPDTGGSGTLLYIIGGLLVMVSAGSILLYKYKRRYRM